ncbi:MAG: hypothetical protein H6742_03710 [Alphaproteobacteria bacterium]|nr:hypothetical protein [Alphaproteobacteria bacterium]
MLSLLVAVIVGHAAIGWHWAQVQGTLPGIVCCEFTELASDTRGRLETLPPGAGLRSALGPYPHGLMVLLSAALGQVLPWTPALLHATDLVLMAAAQLLLYRVVSTLSGRWPALLAAALYPMVPGISVSQRAYAPYAGQWLLLLAATALVLHSRSLSRPGRTLVAGALIAVGGLWSVSPTDNLLFLASGAVLGLAAASGGLVRGRDDLGRPVPAGRVLAGAVLGGGLCATLVVTSWARRGDLRYHLQYVANELGLPVDGFIPLAGHQTPVYEQLADPWTATALLAYPRRLWSWEIGLPGAVLLALGAALWLARGRGRWLVAASALAPVLALSLVAKKQALYAYMALPFFVIAGAAGLGVARSPTGRRASAVLGVAMLGAFGLPWAQQSFVRARGVPVDEWQHHAFQYPQTLELHPLPPGRIPQVPASLDRLPSTCPVEGLLAYDGDGLASPFYAMALSGRCIRLVRSSPDQPLPAGVAGRVHVGAEPCTAAPASPPPGTEGWRRVGLDDLPSGCVELWVVDGGPLDTEGTAGPG